MKRLLPLFLLMLMPAVLAPFAVSGAERGIGVTLRPPQGQPFRLYEDSYALVVGNGRYTKGWDPLPGALQDADDVAAALERNGFSVTLKKDLTRSAFQGALSEFSTKFGAKPENRLLFYYAGHGYTQTLSTGEELGFLVMTDAPAPDQDPYGFRLASVDMQSIVTEARIMNAKHVLFMFDSCFSGSILNLRERVVPQTVSDNVKYPVRQFITAGRANEPVPDHSVFKQAFLNLLEGREREPIPDGYITGEELGLFLKNKVPEYNPAQHPQYGKIRDPRLDQGDFVFLAQQGAEWSEPEPPGPKPGRLYVRTVPSNAAVRLLNIAPRFSQGMELAAGRYHLEVSAEGYEEHEEWIDLGAGEDRDVEIRLTAVPKQAPPAADAVPGKTWTEPVTGMEFVYVPGGCYEMGSPSGEKDRDSDEGLVHEVCVDGFWMGKTEVTNGQFRKFKGGHDSGDYQGNSLNGDDQPVVEVSWEEAKAFAQWLTRQGGGGGSFRLPTEAEWENACRAGTRTARFWGDDPDEACRYANVADRTAKRRWSDWTIHDCDDGYAVTAPVGSFRPNAFGIYDLLGNVWEWCEDWYDKDAYSKHARNNPIVDASGSNRVGRGGSWDLGPRFVRCANRYLISPGDGNFNLGFRLLRTD